MAAHIAPYLAASAQRSNFYQLMLALFEHRDVLALPSAQVWPFDATFAGLPMGLQLIGKLQGELALLQLARADESAAGDVLSVWPTRG